MSEHQPVFTDQQFWEIKRIVREEFKRIFDTGCMGTEEATPKFGKTTVTVGAPTPSQLSRDLPNILKEGIAMVHFTDGGKD